MTRLRALVAVVAVALLATGWLSGQDKKDDKKEAPKVIGVLPTNWGKLGLSEEQRKKVYGIQDDYKKKIDDLQKQLNQLRSKQMQDLEAVLTEEQKKNWKLIQTLQELQGTWTGPSGTVVVIDDDEIFIGKGEEAEFAGLFGIPKAGTLQIIVDGEVALEVPYKVAGDKLTLTIEGQAVEYKRKPVIGRG